MKVILRVSFIVVAAIAGVNISTAQGAADSKTGVKPIIIGFDSEAGHLTSTSDDAIRIGIAIAIEEINARGGVLGRPLSIEERDNRSVPPRGVANARAFGENPDVVAFIAGKFSPVVLEQLDTVHKNGLILLAAWSAADGITRNGFRPNNVFRLSLYDSIAIAALMEDASARGYTKIGLFAPNTGWGRSSLDAAREFARKKGMSIVDVQWHNWGMQEKTFVGSYEKLREAGAQLILMVANEGEGAVFLKDIASKPSDARLPVNSHWGILGGNFPAMAGTSLHEVDLRIVTTITYRTAKSAKARRLLESAAVRLGLAGPEYLTSVVGVAQAYDLVHMLAIAISQAKSIDRAAVRTQLERIAVYDGAMKQFRLPFSATQREALTASDLQMVRFRPDGTLEAAPRSSR